MALKTSAKVEGGNYVGSLYYSNKIKMEFVPVRCKQNNRRVIAMSFKHGMYTPPQA